MNYDLAIIGGGIVGLATAMNLQEKYPQQKIILVEKENHCATHQTGHNSGVIHSGVYYQPGSYKAKLTTQGNQALVKFCQTHNINHDVCGKLIVACNEKELPQLENLYQRGLKNGIAVRKIAREEAREIEPYVNCIQAIKVPTAGIVDYKQVAEKYAEIFTNHGGEIRLNTKVVNLQYQDSEHIIITNQGEIKAKYIVNCAGLYSDKIAKLGGIDPKMKIIPFRGEYYELKPEKSYLVKHLIYPVPNPDFPFLGVHFTRLIDGNIHAGPNAVLSLKREGYKKTDFALGEFLETVTYPGFWKLVSKYYAEGIEEMIRSFSKAAFVRSLQTLIPEVQEDDIIPSPAGVRAQGLNEDGTLVQDFALLPTENALHVCNAPSPAATASLKIGEVIAETVSKVL